MKSGHLRQWNHKPKTQAINSVQWKSGNLKWIISDKISIIFKKTNPPRKAEWKIIGTNLGGGAFFTLYFHYISPPSVTSKIK